MKAFRTIVPMLIVLLLIISMTSTTFAFEFNGEEKQGVQIGEQFYSLEYIMSHIDDFAVIVATAGSNIILDLNGKSGSLADYITSGTTDDFDTWASDPSNQTEPNPVFFVDQDGNQVAVNENEDEDDAMITDAVAKNAVFLTALTGKCSLEVTKVEIIFNETTKEATIEDGTFSYNIVPMMSDGDTIVIKGYVDGELVDTDSIVVGEELQEIELKVIDIY